MLKIYQSNAQAQLLEVPEIVHNSLILLIQPSLDELLIVETALQLPRQLCTAALDQNERPRIEKSPDQIMLLLNAPYRLEPLHDPHTAPYQTCPIGLIHCDHHMIIVCRQQLPMIEQLMAGRFGDFQSCMKTRISLLLFKAIAESYNQHLTQINKQMAQLQQQLKRSYRNHELFALMSLNKSLVYFSTALTAMTLLYQRLMDGQEIKIHQHEAMRLADTLIDLRQATEVTEMRRESASNLMDAYAAIIHNNLNSVLKILTTLAIVMMIPTMIGSIFSMNVALPYEEQWISTIVISISMLVLVTGLLLLFYKKKYLRIR
ncbi:magnesium transporter CorA family protein [Acinetobacter larvae]|uniref:Magnesium transporter n=1 Tax=Acinetobacter larvae TaxID=1789224 RepID=A0A1B2M313_9GAMM|nr:magnesium transporter CorA family protein [Acinetobacter larvae]AOA59569.1 hypothetical protein BFG52_15265 [Acinetobacter larvae]